MSENPRNSPISWEAERASLPERPALSSNLNAEARIPRPRRLLIVVGLFVGAALTSIATIVLGALVLDDVRTSIVAALPEDITSEYSAEGVQQAATLLLAIAAGLIVVLLVVQALALNVFVIRRSNVARVAFAVASVGTAAAVAMSLFLRDPRSVDLVIGATACGCMLLSAMLACTPLTTRWLRQSEESHAIVLADAVSGTPDLKKHD